MPTKVKAFKCNVCNTVYNGMDHQNPEEAAKECEKRETHDFKYDVGFEYQTEIFGVKQDCTVRIVDRKYFLEDSVRSPGRQEHVPKYKCLIVDTGVIMPMWYRNAHITRMIKNPISEPVSS